MNTERTPYRAEDDEGDDSTAVSFGSGPAFRPVPRIERPAPPAPEKPPRLLEGLLFDRASSVIRTEAAKPKQAEANKDTDSKEDRPEIPAPRAASRAAETGPRKIDMHLPDIGEFIGTLPEAPAIPSQRSSVEQIEVHPKSENEPSAPAYPMETVADLPEWPENEPDSAGPAPEPVPPRQSPVFAPTSSEAPAFNATHEDDESKTPAAAPGTGGGGGGLPPTPPPRAGGPGPGSAPGGQPAHRYNALYSSGGGGGSVGYNPNAAPTSLTSSFEKRAAPIVVQKKGNIWPYVAVLAENIARKRADRKLKKELSGRMDQQDKAQEESNANQLRLERQQQQMLDEQRRQTIREARRPSGHEWGVPQYSSPMNGPGRAPGQRFTGERPASVPRAEGPVPIPIPGAEQQPADAQELEAMQPGERVKQSAWHTYIEGKSPQEAAQSLHYGEGFRREQKEIMRDRTGDAVAAGVAGAIGTAHALGGRPAGASRTGASGSAAGGSYYGQGGSYSNVLPSGMTTPGLPGGAHADAQHQLPPSAPKKPTAHVPGPLFWLMVALILVAFFAAALI